MITEYLRPKTIEEAIDLLRRSNPKTIAIGGGSSASHSSGQAYAVVDLQDLGLNYIHRENGKITFGATITLSQLENEFAHTDLFEVIGIQATRNQRNTSTLVGLMKKADGRSPILTALLAMDAQLVWEPGNITLSLGNWLTVRDTWQEAVLIKEVVLPEVKFVCDSIARSPKDRPILCCTVARWPNGRTRACVGGFGKIPLLISDGNLSDNLEIAIQSALSNSEDTWASAAYRKEIGPVMIHRLATRLLVQ